MTAVRLSLLDEAGGGRWLVWPTPATALPRGAVQETRRYTFELEGDSSCASADLFIDEEPLEALRAPPGKARWRWSPGFHAGTVDGVLRLAGQAAIPFSVVTDPDVEKLTREAFAAMVSEILEDSLALMSLSGYRIGIGRGSGERPPPVARLEFLRSRLPEVERAVLDIARAPRERMEADAIRVPYHRVRHITGPELSRSLRSGRTVTEAGRQPHVLPSELRGTFPLAIETRRRFSSVDTPENRQVLACLRAWAEWLDAAAVQLAALGDASGAGGMQHAKWARRCRQLAFRLGRLTHLPAFNDVARVRPVMRLTAVFRRDGRYGRFYRVWRDFHLGLANLRGDFLEVPLARTYQLYEHWCYLRLTRAAALMAEQDGLTVSKLFSKERGGGFVLTAGASSVTAGEITIAFQRTYREYWREQNGAGSYSRDMTPDLVVKTNGSAAPILVVLDAKYRVGEAIGQAISSIHMYRDALVEEAPGGPTSGRPTGVVKAAYVITPKVPGELKAEDYRETGLPQRFFHPDYRKRFLFGGLILAPGMALSDIVSLLRSVLADAATAQA